MTRHAALTALAALLTLALVAPVTAAPPRASVPDVEDEVMCVVCGTPLNVSESPQADRERAFIRDLVAQGKTKDQIKDELVATYGRNVLALPESGGFDAAAYVVPIAAVLLAAGALALALPRWRRRRPAAAGADGAAAPSGSEARRLDEDLARYDL